MFYNSDNHAITDVFFKRFMKVNTFNSICGYTILITLNLTYRFSILVYVLRLGVLREISYFQEIMNRTI